MIPDKLQKLIIIGIIVEGESLAVNLRKGERGRKERRKSNRMIIDHGRITFVPRMVTRVVSCKERKDQMSE